MAQTLLFQKVKEETFGFIRFCKKRIKVALKLPSKDGPKKGIVKWSDPS